jgi:hypothetical protein
MARDFSHQIVLVFTREGKFYQRVIDLRTPKGKTLASLKIDGQTYPFELGQSHPTRWTPWIEPKWYNPFGIVLESIAKYRFRPGVQLVFESRESALGAPHPMHVSESDFRDLTPAIVKARIMNLLYEKYEKRVRIGSAISGKTVIIIAVLLIIAFVILTYTGSLGG